MNKTSISIITGALVLVLSITSSCSDALNENLYSSVPVSSFYKSQDQAQLALNGVYAQLWAGAMYKDQRTLQLSDQVGGLLTGYPNRGTFDDFSWTISDRSFQDNWTNTYQMINRANTLLDKLPDSKIADDPKKKISGQAKFLRALCYFNLVKDFGGVPLYTKGTFDLSDIDKPRNNADEVYQQIIKDLQDATTELSPYSESDHTAGKATSLAAQSLLAKVYAQRRNWSEAASTAKKVIDSGSFGLFTDYANVLDPAHNNGKEKIFSIQHGNGGNPTTNIGEHLVYLFGPPPTTTPDGTSVIFFHISKGVFWNVNKSFFSSTPDTYRKYQTMRDKMPSYYPVGADELVNQTVPLARPFIVKYYHLDTSSGNLMTGVQFPILRYSDILLTYAESVNEANGGPTQAAYDAINLVRARARGVGTANEQPESVYPPLSGLNQSAFRDSVLTEMARELVGERKRRAELLRHDRFISDAQDRGIDAQDYQKLFPIPVEEINRNKNLEQNDGYTNAE